MLTDFVKKLNALKPKRELLEKKGYSKERIEEIYTQEFDLIKKDEIISVDSMIDDFIYNYNLSYKFSIRNLTFSNDLEEEIIEGHLIFGGIESGYISYKRSSDSFYVSYGDDVEGTLGEICENSINFFEVLLVVAQYNCDWYENPNLNADTPDKEIEAIIETYIKKCDAIYPYGDYYTLFL